MLYPEELQNLLNRGGVIAWGIVPNDRQIDSTTPRELADRLLDGIHLICEKAAARGVVIDNGRFEYQSLVSPACGLGSTTVEVADKVISVLVETGDLLRGQNWPQNN
jgi:hypothetical protein